jgi:GNAT superfamily N-acetyltransferase
VAPYVEADFDDAARDSSLFVSECDTAVVGVVALAAPGSPERAVARGEEAELRRLAVAKSARGRGIGRKLVECCVELARAEGWTAIALWSREYQTAAHRLYESLGYVREPGRDSTDETGHSRLVFRLDV